MLSLYFSKIEKSIVFEKKFSILEIYIVFYFRNIYNVNIIYFLKEKFKG